MIRLLPVFLLAGCGTTFHMPAPVAYPGACPPENRECQRNADAQTLHYIGETDAARRLMCADSDLAFHMGEGCGGLPALY